MFCSPSTIVEMDVERDRKACIALAHRTAGADRELAQWLIDHPRYSAVAISQWLGCSESRIRSLRRWAENGFPGASYRAMSNRHGADQHHGADEALNSKEKRSEGKNSMSYLPPHEDVLRAAEKMGMAAEKKRQTPSESNGSPVKLSAFAAKKRQNRLDQTLLHIRESCETTRDMSIPDDLSPVAINEAVLTLSASIELIGRLMRRLLKDEGEDL